MPLFVAQVVGELVAEQFGPGRGPRPQPHRLAAGDDPPTVGAKRGLNATLFTGLVCPVSGAPMGSPGRNMFACSVSGCESDPRRRSAVRVKWFHE